MSQNNFPKPQNPKNVPVDGNYGELNPTPQSQAGPDIPATQVQLDALRFYVDQQIFSHYHNGSAAQRIQLDTDIGGLFEVVSSVPSGTPLSVYDQLKIYESAGTHRLYWYDQVTHAWRYATGT